jgi:predicted MFS family arabinose efflux permease
MVAGSLLTAAGLLLASAASSFLVYAVAWLILGVAMRLALYEAAFATLTAAAGREARRAISVLTLYGGFASSIFWPIGYGLVEAVGWRATFVAFAAMNLIICAPLHAFALPRPVAAVAPGDAPAARTEGSLKPGDRRPAFWLLTAALALFTYVNSALSAHLIDTLVAFDLSRGEAVGIASLRGVGQVVGRLWEILFAAGLPPLALCLIAIGLTPLAIGALLIGAGALTGTTFALLQGGSNGLVTIVRGVAPLLLFGAKDYGALIGAMTAPGLFVSALAPACHAAIIDLAGQGAALAVATGAVVLAFVLVLALAIRLARQQ